MKKFEDNSFMLHTDLYQINMIKTYYMKNMHNTRAVFEAYFRNMPFTNGYAIFAGLERIIDYVKDLRFTESDLEYLKTLGYEEAFLSYLKGFKFTGTIRAMHEGEVVFNNEPLVQVDTTLAEAQLMETAILNIINYQTLIATKASRLRELVPNDQLMEFGTRRAHEFDAAIWGARAAIIGGFDGTSNVRAAKKFGITPSGTHAHAMVQAFGDDYRAFKAYAETHKECVFLVDTFDTIKSGIPNAIKVADEMGDKINFIGIRLDSGDIAYLSKVARKMLDEAGYPNAKVIVSNDLDEMTILSLKSQGAKVDGWGIGTKLITAYDQPALGAVYKLSAIEVDGELVDRMKISGNVEKLTTPGKKEVYRIINNETGKSEGDYITRFGEEIDTSKELFMFDPVHTVKRKYVKNFTPVKKLNDIFVDGELVYRKRTIAEIKQVRIDRLEELWEENRRLVKPQIYPVDLSLKLWTDRQKLIEDLSEREI
ncbi:nicotinate phosphoribosyltransferase [Phocicoccus pinnipedialis]|uniref:Nicotinate phosphoribosyltransferase n=1 Tax=Phocicoccus pinnipedialis TaxID=110845 RepID=A0A6V7R994_9BACL|nr:nicotinate phosphoribosyltransferase [Jeotgalicoccus pinnipedialis]MBP1940203.1 nicotinate phosphoribosyltransferase [Jeotgalicoccus pinnipedialis]CAD2073999.1 Nicotinate phosphoribosyltransferase pncB2 [Jeotgalicoccus pinnipedialis]